MGCGPSVTAATESRLKGREHRCERRSTLVPSQLHFSARLALRIARVRRSGPPSQALLEHYGETDPHVQPRTVRAPAHGRFDPLGHPASPLHRQVFREGRQNVIGSPEHDAV